MELGEFDLKEMIVCDIFMELSQWSKNYNYYRQILDINDR